MNHAELSWTLDDGRTVVEEAPLAETDDTLVLRIPSAAIRAKRAKRLAVTLGYGNVDGAFTVEIGERINVVKTGTGTLTVSGVALANTCDLTVEAGTVVFAGDSSSYGTVRVKSGATFDSRGTRFSCERIIKERGGTVLPPAATVLYMR